VSYGLNQTLALADRQGKWLFTIDIEAGLTGQHSSKHMVMIGSSDHHGIELRLSNHLSIIRECCDVSVRYNGPDRVNAWSVAITDRYDPSIVGHVTSKRLAADPGTNQADGDLIICAGTAVCPAVG
jgi:hypothetical protein